VFLRLGFCRQFPSDFPSRDGHPCLKLMVATLNPIADFHCQAITHARRKDTHAFTGVGIYF